MSKDFPKTGEGGTAAPTQPDKVGPVAGNVDPQPSTAAVSASKDQTADFQKLLDEAAKTATKEKPAEVELPAGKSVVVTHALRLPEHVKIKGTIIGSPEEHAKALGGVKTVQRSAVVGNQPASFELYHQFHAAAEALHGWREHAHHAGKPIQLTRAEYEAALKAAAAPVTRALDKDGKPTGEPIDSHEAAAKGTPTITDYEPHVAALSPHRGKGL